jgi:hypothetical protein
MPAQTAENTIRTVSRAIRAEIAKLPEGDTSVDLAREKLADGVAQLDETATALRRATRQVATASVADVA